MPKRTSLTQARAKRALQSMTVAVKESTIEFKKLDPETRKKISEKTILRLYDGEDIAAIAADIGVRNPALLLAAVIQDCPDELRFIRAGAALFRRMELEKKLEQDATDGERKEQLDFKKQQALVKSTEWDLERMSREVFEPPQRAPVASPTIIMQFADLRNAGKPAIEAEVPALPEPEPQPITRFDRIISKPD